MPNSREAGPTFRTRDRPSREIHHFPFVKPPIFKSKMGMWGQPTKPQPPAPVKLLSLLNPIPSPVKPQLAGPQGRRIREACGHMRRPWKRDGPSTFPARRNASSPKNCERTSRVRMCARLPRVFGLSHFLGPIQIFQSENLCASLFNPKTSLPGQLGRRRTDFRPKMVSRVTPKALPELPRCAPWSSAGGSVSRWETRLDQDAST